MRSALLGGNRMARQEVLVEIVNGFRIWVCEPRKGGNHHSYTYETIGGHKATAAALEDARERIGRFGGWRINCKSRLVQAKVGLLLMIMTDRGDSWVRDDWQRSDWPQREARLAAADKFLYYHCDLRWDGYHWVDRLNRSVFHATAEIAEIITRLIEDGGNE